MLVESYLNLQTYLPRQGDKGIRFVFNSTFTSGYPTIDLLSAQRVIFTDRFGTFAPDIQDAAATYNWTFTPPTSTSEHPLYIVDLESDQDTPLLSEFGQSKPIQVFNQNFTTGLPETSWSLKKFSNPVKTAIVPANPIIFPKMKLLSVNPGLQGCSPT